MKAKQKNNAYIRHIFLLLFSLFVIAAAPSYGRGESSSGDSLATTAKPKDVEGFVLRPGAATVKINRTVSLSVKSCSIVGIDNPDPDLAPVPRLVCIDAAGEVGGPDEQLAPLPYPPKEWAVNGIPGGNRTVGTVTGKGWTATYKAPSAKPKPNTVAVSATIASKKGNKKGKTLLVSNITIEGDDVNYTGTVRFSMTFRGGGEVSGSADVAWTEFEHPEEEEGAKWYLPSGMITANINMRNCDPLHVSGPIETGSAQKRRGGSMTIFPVNHSGQPRQYFFGLVGDRNNNIKLCCVSGKDKKCLNTALSHFVSFTIAQCGESHEPYTDTKVLRGKRDSEHCRLSWKFTAQ
jgi:hypothetical protein